MTVTPSACRYCGIERHDHFRRWSKEVKWHGWTAPTQEQIKARMLERRAERLAPKPLLAITPEMLVTITANAGALYRAFAPAETPPVRPTDAG